MASPQHYFHGVIVLSVPLQCDLTQICQSTWGTTDASPLGIGLNSRRGRFNDLKQQARNAFVPQE